MIAALLDLVFPPRCAGCGRAGLAWCLTCAAAVRPLPVRPLGTVVLLAAASLEGRWQQAVHTYKYRPRPQLARMLAVNLAAAARGAGLPLQALAYVPLHDSRRKERGFNQAERLARELAPQLGLPVVDGLVRTRATPPQVGLTEAQRRRNVAGAFVWSGSRPPPTPLGLVDDVCTTGATLEAAAAAIRQAGGEVGAYLVLASPQTLRDPAVTYPE